MMRRLEAARTSPSQRTAKKPERANSRSPVALLISRPQRRQVRMASFTPDRRRWPNSSADRYMAATRTPEVPTSMANTPMVETSCSSPRPAAPICAERKT